MIEFSIKRVKNGFILKVINEGCSLLKESYIKPIYVFNSYNDMINFIKRELKEV